MPAFATKSRCHNHQCSFFRRGGLRWQGRRQQHTHTEVGLLSAEWPFSTKICFGGTLRRPIVWSVSFDKEEIDQCLRELAEEKEKFFFQEEGKIGYCPKEAKFRYFLLGFVIKQACFRWISLQYKECPDLALSSSWTWPSRLSKLYRTASILNN